jgi:hypothetical protein
MPVSSTHPQYKVWEKEWEKCRDTYNGQTAVKSRGEVYLPKLSAQTIDEYNSYKHRALFYPITGKSVNGLTGLVVAKDPILKYPPSMKSYFEDQSGTEFYELFSSSTREAILMGRGALFVDRPRSGGRPQIHVYTAENVLNWKLDPDTGVPTMVVLRECVVDDTNVDKFEHLEKWQYRVLEMIDGVYTQTIFDNEGATVGGQIVPVNRGQMMDFIPLRVFNHFGMGFYTVKPPSLDIADVNISHYMTSADLEHGRHFTALPTPVAIGVDSSTVLKVGSMTAWVIPSEKGDAKYLEFTGQGLQSLEVAMKEKQTQLASLSTRVLDNSHNGSEATDAVRLRYMSETASLSSVARSVEAVLNWAYNVAAVMEGESPDAVTVKIDKELLNTRLSPAELMKLTESYFNGGMSTETYVFNLRRGDMLANDRTDQEEIAELEKTRDEMLAAKQKSQSSGNGGNTGGGST